MVFPRGLRPHVAACRTLPLDVRKRQAEQRQTYFGRNHWEQLATAAPAASSSASAAPVEAVVPVRRFRLTRKRPAPPGYEAPQAPQPTADKTVAPCGDWQLSFLH